MAKSWAIVIGIDQYDHLSEEEHLKYAVRDAEHIRSFLCGRAEFQQDFVILCSDKSEPVSGLNTRPTRSNLRRILLNLSENSQAQGAEQAWFFFSGHGLLGEDNQDYLLTADAYPGDLKDTAISVNFVIQQLTKCSARNTVLVLDMCRNETASSKKGSSTEMGERIMQLAQQNGITTIFSCSRGGYSYELPELKQGAFTYAFLQGLNQYISLRQLDEYLCTQIFELTKRRQPRQVPIISVEPPWKYDLPLLKALESHTGSIESLIEQATIALYKDRDLPLAKQLWESVNDGAINLQDKKRSREALIEIDQQLRNDSDNISSQFIQLQCKTDQTPSRTDTAPLSEAKGSTASLLEETLISDQGIDYTRLQDLLAEKRWKEADEETKYIILKLAKKDYLTDSDILSFPCNDLNIIDQLWVRYSKGWFGFSVQKEIYLQCGGKLDRAYHASAWESFGKAVGWRNSGDWHWRDNLTFSVSALKGHLPTYVWSSHLCSVFSRIDICKNVVGTED